MEKFANQKSKNQAKISIKKDGLPTPEVVNPTVVDRQVVSFYDDTEEKFLQRELVRAKLKKYEKAGASSIIIPEASDIEQLTRAHYLRLSDKSQNGNEYEKLEIKMLKKTYNSTSLVNIATRLAEATLYEREKNEAKSWFTLGPAESRTTKDILPAGTGGMSRRASESGFAGGSNYR